MLCDINRIREYTTQYDNPDCPLLLHFDFYTSRNVEMMMMIDDNDDDDDDDDDDDAF